MDSTLQLWSNGGVTFLLPSGPFAIQTQFRQPSAAGHKDAQASTAAPWPQGGFVWAATSCAAIAVAASVSATRPRHRRAQRRHVGCKRQQVALLASVVEEVPVAVSRASLIRVLSSIGASCVAVPAALAKNIDESKEELARFGLASLLALKQEELPNNWSYVVEPLGLTQDYMLSRFKAGNEPIMVVFPAPPGWSTAKPNTDLNGTSGTVSANNNSSGDSATIFIDTDFKGKLAAMTQDEIFDAVYKALTRKSKAQMEELKIRKVYDTPAGYKIVQYDYFLSTGAGFLIQRSGVASIGQVTPSGHLQILWTATLMTRVEEMRASLIFIAENFRAGAIDKQAVMSNPETQLKKAYVDFPEAEA